MKLLNDRIGEFSGNIISGRGFVSLFRKILCSIIFVVLVVVVTACSRPLESSYTINGKKVILRGGDEHNVTEEEGKTTIRIGSHNIVITRNYITVNGKRNPLPDFRVMEIDVDGSSIKVSYNKDIENESEPERAGNKARRRQLPREFVQLKHGNGTGRVFYLIDKREGSAVSALKKAVGRLANYFDNGIEDVEGFSDVNDTMTMVTFSARVGGHPVSGIAISMRTGRESIVGFVYDRVERIRQSIMPLMAELERGLPGGSASNREQAALRWYTAVFPDGTGRIRLPEGWRITSSYQGAVEISGSNGEGVSLGIAIPVATPEAARNPLTGQIMQGAIVGYPRNPVDAMYEIPEQAAANMGASFAITRIIEATPVQSATGGQAAYVLYDATVNGIPRRALSLIDCSPVSAGWWSFYYSTVAAPPERFARILPVMLKIWESWSVNPDVFRKRLQNAMRAMQETNRMITEAADYRMKTFEKGLVDWTEVFRGDRAVKDTLTGEMKYTDIGWAKKQVEKLNELQGYNRYKEIPLRDLMVN